MTLRLKEILEQKGSVVHRITPEASMAEAVASLVAHNCGSLVVCDGEQMVGIITERDLLRTMAEVDKPLDEIPVRDRMTAELVTARPEAEIGEVMGLLTRRRIRHLPVVENTRLVGLISIGDVVKAHHDQLTMENHFLKEYLQG